MSEFKAPGSSVKGLEGEQRVNHSGEAVMEASSHSAVKDEKRAGLAVDVSAERDAGGSDDHMKENKVEKWYRQMKETMSVIDKVLLMELLRVWMQDQSGQEHRRGGMFDPWSRL